MRTEKELLIATKAYAAENRSVSWQSLAITLALYVVSLAICASNAFLPLRIVSSITSGLIIVRLFIFYHDFQHQTILTHSRLARWIMNGYGLLVLSPPSVWTRSHNHHHKHNSKDLLSSMGSYPTMTCQQYAKASTRERSIYYWSRHPLTIVSGYLTVFLFGMCVRALWLNPRQHRDAGVALLLHVALIWLLIGMGLDSLLLCLIVPLFVACGLGSYLFYAQHNFPGCHLGSREDWTHASAALKSSSYLKMNHCMNWFTGNIGYHHIHHLNAKIPFYRLQEAMAGLPELQKPASTTLHPRDVWACFQSNLWDPDKKRFVSFREAAGSV